MNFDRIVRAEARLIMLRELNAQADGRLNSALLQAALENFGLTKTRDWVHDELNWMLDKGLIGVRDLGSVRIAEIAQKGRDHVERRTVIEGVKRPSAEF